MAATDMNTQAINFGAQTQNTCVLVAAMLDNSKKEKEKKKKENSSWVIVGWRLLLKKITTYSIFKSINNLYSKINNNMMVVFCMFDDLLAISVSV